MTTEKHDPWALLREARDELSVLASYVGHPDTVWPNVGLKTTAKCHKIMRDRIDAALAAHDAVPSSEVKWRQPCYGSHIYDDGIFRHKVELWGSKWRWFVAIDYRTDGFSPSLDEAKAAAIAAARGMR